MDFDEKIHMKLGGSPMCFKALFQPSNENSFELILMAKNEHLP